jgi:HSP20 family molecular chaperone IbpA
MKHAPKSAAKVMILENSNPISAETEAIQSRIRERAFELSQARPVDAHALYDWIMAESEVVSVPPMELLERDEKFELRFAVAGIDPYNVNVMVTPDQILLKSAYNHQHDSQVGIVHHCDFKSATIFRSVKLPQPVDVNSITVDFFDGILLISALKQGADTAGLKRATLARKTPAKKSRAKLS